MQIHFRLPWIEDQLHQQTTRTYRTKIEASRYKVRVSFLLNQSHLNNCRREINHAHTSHFAVHNLHHGHCDPLRLLLGHQAAQGREGAGGCRYSIIYPFTPEAFNCGI